MTKIQNSAVLGALLALNELSRLKLPAVGAYKVIRLLPVLSQAWEDVEQVRQQMVEQHAERDAAGEIVQGEPQVGEDGSVQPTIQLTEEGRVAFAEAWAALMAQEIEVPTVLSIADLGRAEVEPPLLGALGKLLGD